jgi:hypothetical protein
MKNKSWFFTLFYLGLLGIGASTESEEASDNKKDEYEIYIGNKSSMNSNMINNIRHPLSKPYKDNDLNDNIFHVFSLHSSSSDF